MQKHIGKAAARKVNAPLSPTKRTDVKPFHQPPDKFTYALPAFTAEIRKDGWYVARSIPTFAGEKQKWTGPFVDIENAGLSIARQLFVELADRHTRAVEAHGIKPGTPLYGLKETTRLRAK